MKAGQAKKAAASNVKAGGRLSTDELLSLVYDELHAAAEAQMRRERLAHTLQPTALIHEAYLRLARRRTPLWQSRTHFLCVAVRAMRQILVDSARGHRRAKRGGQWKRTPLHETVLIGETPDLDLVALDEALTRLSELNAEHARLVELKFFGGLSNEEAAEILRISTATVARAWRAARAWLYRELSGARTERR